MVGKRIVAHIINKSILLIPSLLLLGGIALLVYPTHFIFGKDDSGWLMIYLYKYMIILPTVFLDLIKEPASFFGIINILLPALICLIILEIISIIVMKRDIGMRMMGLKIISTKARRLSFIQIVIRTVVKYFSFAFFPFVLVYVFLNEKKITFHDKVSSTMVVEVEK